MKLKYLSKADYWEQLIAYGKIHAQSAAALIDTRPEKWIEAVEKLRDLCEVHNVPDELQFKVVFVNLMRAAIKN
jgi:hypothetical protein